jgi:hypothetical protein
MAETALRDFCIEDWETRVILGCAGNHKPLEDCDGATSPQASEPWDSSTDIPTNIPRVRPLQLIEKVSLPAETIHSLYFGMHKVSMTSLSPSVFGPSVF